MTHDELRDLAAAYAIGALGEGQRAELEAHIAECAECRADIESLAPVVQGLAYTVPIQAPPASLRARILAAAERETPSVAPTGETVSHREWSWRAMAAVAALIVVAIGLGTYAIAMRNRVLTLESGLRDAIAAMEQVDAELAALRRLAEENQSAKEVLSSSELARIDLQGQPAAAAARARAFWSRGSGLVFTASALPPVPAGRGYQLWVLTDGAPISAGMLQPDASGSVETFIPTPLDLPAPVGMAVTVEPAGGVPAPTTAPVLVGKVT
jgi:anti-sigma-K factor RskA